MLELILTEYWGSVPMYSIGLDMDWIEAVVNTVKILRFAWKT